MLQLILKQAMLDPPRNSACSIYNHLYICISLFIHFSALNPGKKVISRRNCDFSNGYTKKMRRDSHEADTTFIYDQLASICCSGEACIKAGICMHASLIADILG